MPNPAGTETELLHFHMLAFFGMPIGEMWNLEALAEDCAADGHYDFFLTSAPLNVPGGVGSPPNALANYLSSARTEAARANRTLTFILSLRRNRGVQCPALVSASVVKKLLSTAPMLMYQHSRSGVSGPGKYKLSQRRIVRRCSRRPR